MDYRCPVCGRTVKNDLKTYIDHTEQHIIDIIQNKHPGWVEKDGVCRKCKEYLRGQIHGKE